MKPIHYGKGVLSDALFLTAKNLANSLRTRALQQWTSMDMLYTSPSAWHTREGRLCVEGDSIRIGVGSAVAVLPQRQCESL